MGQVRDIMEKNVITIEHNKTALDVSKLLKEKEISFVVISKEEEPIGLVSERDIVRKISAEDKKASEVSIEEVMSKNFRWVRPQDDIEIAIQKMLNNSIRRLLVIDNEKLVGVITQTDLASYLRSKLLINGTVEKLESD
ncbi:MAG: CBS domain-containing protein [Nitrosopumilaceae archaeon]|nr:CBS domain-containing protein [Nitrosopumilaceae archaeon]